MALFLSSASLRSLAAIAHYVPPISAPSKASVTSSSSNSSSRRSSPFSTSSQSLAEDPSIAEPLAEPSVADELIPGRADASGTLKYAQRIGSAAGKFHLCFLLPSFLFVSHHVQSTSFTLVYLLLPPKVLFCRCIFLLILLLFVLRFQGFLVCVFPANWTLLLRSCLFGVSVVFLGNSKISLFLTYSDSYCFISGISLVLAYSASLLWPFLLFLLFHSFGQCMHI